MVLTPQHLIHGMNTDSAGMVRHAQTSGSGGSQRKEHGLTPGQYRPQLSEFCH